MATQFGFLLPPITAEPPRPRLRPVPRSGAAAPAAPAPPPPSTGGYRRSGPRPAVLAAVVALHLAAGLALVAARHQSRHDLPRAPMLVVNLPAPTPPPADTVAPPEPVLDPVAVDVPAPDLAIAPAPSLAPAVAPVPQPVAAPASAPPAAVASGLVAPAAGPAPADLAASLVEGRPPAYPYESRRRHEEGTVVLAVVLAPDGRPQTVDVAQSSGFDRLDRAARDAVRGWRWRPQIAGGVAVAVRGFVEIPFRLQRGR